MSERPLVINDKPRIVLFDIEANNLKANIGYCIAFGYTYLGGKPKVLSVMDYPKTFRQDPTDDRALMQDIHRILTEESDIIITYYGKEFDRKFLNTRMVAAGLMPLPPLNSEHIDLFFTVRGNFSLHSKRLAVVADFLKCPIKKTEIAWEAWRRAGAGHVPSLGEIIDHCTKDVAVLRWCYVNKLRPYVRLHPWVVLKNRGLCRVCGSPKVQRRGYSITSGVRKIRLQCQGCGYWSSANVT